MGCFVTKSGPRLEVYPQGSHEQLFLTFLSIEAEVLPVLRDTWHGFNSSIYVYSPQLPGGTNNKKLWDWINPVSISHL